MAKKRNRVKKFRPPKGQLKIASFLPGVRGASAWSQETHADLSGGTVNIYGVTGKQHLPSGDDPESRCVRLHELLHAAHSPLEPPRDLVYQGQILYKNTIEIVEEFRINLVLRGLVGTGQLPDETDQLKYARKLFEQYFKTPNMENLQQIFDWQMILWPLDPAVDFFGPSTGSVLRELLAYREQIMSDLSTPVANTALQIDALYDVMYELQSLVFAEWWNDPISDYVTYGQIPRWDQVLELALKYQTALSHLHDALNPKSTPVDSDNAFNEFKDAGDIESILKSMGYLKGEAKTELPPGFGISDSASKVLRQERQKAKTPAQVTQDQVAKVRWGKMVIRKAKLSWRLPKKFVARSAYRATDEGAVPRYIHRMPIDGKIFGRKKRTPGGSVLIDDSGSMHWDDEEIRDILKAAPATTIAAYSGNYNIGELVIIAEDGFAANVNDPGVRPNGANNLVDYPALLWLAEQEAPRIWVTDGHVVPEQGDYKAAAYQCFKFAKDNGINIVFDAEEAKEVFEGKRAIYR